MEHLAWAYAENWDVHVVALRYFTVYGTGQRPDMAIHSFIAHATADELAVVYGDGEPIRDFTYVSDAAAATIAATAVDVPRGSVFNVAGGSSRTVNNVLRLVSEALGREVVVRHLPRQPGDVLVTRGAIDRATRVLGWEPLVPLDDGIKQQVVHQIGV